MTKATSKPELKYWQSTIPTKCSLCYLPITDFFIDGATRMGPWACMCPLCANTIGTGFGVGRGQGYRKQDDGTWIKTIG